MIQLYSTVSGELRPVAAELWPGDPPVAGAALPEGVVWIDLLEPTPGERAAVEAAIGGDLPSRSEMEEIESSSQLWSEAGTLWMTVLMLWGTEAARPATVPVSFVRRGGILTTVRYADPRPFRSFAARCVRQPKTKLSGDIVLVGLLETVADRAADTLQELGSDIDRMTALSLARRGGGRHADDHLVLGATVRRIGHRTALLSKVQESLITLRRLLTFFQQEAGRSVQAEVQRRMASLDGDVRSLSDQAHFLSDKLGFLLDSTFGRINIAQNEIVKIFSMLAVLFLPPILVASIYGMNFVRLPERHWVLGYPMAILLMIASALIPFMWFKRRRWL